jgi:hypothetical protein
MARLGKPLAEFHITLAGLAKICAADLASIEGPKFITSSSRGGTKTLAVLISHDKWKTLNHNLPQVDSDKALPFYVGNNAYVVIPCEPHIGSVLRPKRSTGLEIITRQRSKRDD